ncbi:MAG: hypothetical protein KA160_03235 [Lacibacter sp.]|nr:hypothetical protein [Lacibacter sp.]
MNTKLLKGYFKWSIPFLFFACNSGPSTESFLPPDPQNCEWYVQKEKGDNDSANTLGLYTLRFYADGNYTLCADLLFEQGKWVFDSQKKLLVLDPVTGDTTIGERYLIDQSEPGKNTQFSFYSTYPVDKANPDELVKVQAITNSSKSDPFKSEMHVWRTRPAQQENEVQIKQRVVAYLKFLLAFYQHAKENNLENPGGNWYPQPVKFYNNKVRMAYEDELADWYTCFYSKDDAVKGYQVISGALMTVKIEGEDDVTRNINCLEQLLGAVQK